MLKSFVGAIKIKVDDIEFGLDVDPEKGAADSGDLEIDLPSLFTAFQDGHTEKTPLHPHSSNQKRDGKHPTVTAHVNNPQKRRY